MIIFISLGVLLHLVYLYTTIEGDITSHLKKLKWYYLAVLAILAVMPTIFHSFRLYLWSRFVGHPLEYNDALTVVISNDLGSALTPTVVGGGPVKLAMLMSKGMPGTKATFLVLLSATEDIVFYAIGIGLSLYYVQDSLGTLVGSLVEHKLVLIIIVVSFMALYLSSWLKNLIYKILLSWFSQKVKKKVLEWKDKSMLHLKKIGNAYVDIYHRGKLLFLLSLTCLILQWMAKFSVLAVILYALDIDFTYFVIYIKQWILTLGLLIVPTPGASGGAEAAFLLMFGDILSGDTMKLIMSIWRFFTYFFMMFTSVVIFQFLSRRTLNQKS